MAVSSAPAPFQEPTPPGKTPLDRHSAMRMILCAVLGFSSGLPLFVFLNLLPAWADAYHLNIKTIGLLALLQIPYAAKWAWSPLLDWAYLDKVGRRRTWLMILPFIVMGLIAALGVINPATQMSTLVVIGLLLSFASASLDIVIDAYRRELLPDQELGLGSTIHVNAYKLAALVPGSLALILADHIPWLWVYVITALFMLPCVLLGWFVKEPQLRSLPPRGLQQAFTEPLREFFGRQGVKAALLILLFIFFYKLGDSLATALATKFYLDMGYTKTQIGAVAKVAALWGGVVGGFIGGFAMIKLSINRALWVFGVAQTIVLLLFVWLSMQANPSTAALGIVVAGEAFGVSLGTAAFVAYIAKTTNPLYTAAQLALLTSLAAIPRTVVNSSAGALIESLGGYTPFFWLCIALCIPGLLLLPFVAPWHEKTVSPAQ